MPPHPGSGDPNVLPPCETSWDVLDIPGYLIHVLLPVGCPGIFSTWGSVCAPTLRDVLGYSKYFVMCDTGILGQLGMRCSNSVC